MVMLPVKTRFRGLEFESWKCPKCKETIFTEQQSLDVVRALDQQRLEIEYHKHPMRIGRSWGMTFPKDVARVFHLNDKSAKFRIVPDVSAGKIIIEIEE
jgi:hypothetical protein